MKQLTRADIKIGDKFKVIQNCPYKGMIVTVNLIYPLEATLYDFASEEYDACWKLNTQVIPYVEESDYDKDIQKFKDYIIEFNTKYGVQMQAERLSQYDSKYLTNIYKYPVTEKEAYNITSKDLRGIPSTFSKMEKEEKPTKQSEGKLFYEIDWNVIEGLAKRMQLNKQNGKYDVFGWRDKGVNVEEMNQALIRHLVAILKGEHTEDEQQFSHYYALIANSMLIINQLNKEYKQLNK